MPIFGTNEKSIEICFNDVHPLKMLLPILITEDGIAICVNEEQPQKAQLSISVTKEGIIICFNDLQLRKAWFPIDFKEDELFNETSTNSKQETKQ